MEVSYVSHMGDDLMVANAARVSFSKHRDEGDWTDKPGSDKRLLDYLASHRHWTPFAHPQISLRIKAPIFVRTQCFKHKQGFVENEVSRRYVDDEPTFFVPDAWRGRPRNSKQGSSDEVISTEMNGYIAFCLGVTERYERLIREGVAPEQARMILPQSMYTEWYWTGSLAAYARFYKQRSDEHAQKEIQDLAALVSAVIEPLFPVSWRALID